MSSYFLRHTTMGALAMLTLVAVGIARHAAPNYFIALVIVGVLQGVVVLMLGRRPPS